MDFEQGLLTRRSCRRFQKNRTIPVKDVQDIVKIAMHAPSGRDTQCWEFVLIDNKKTFEEIMKFHPYTSFLKDASLVIAVCGNTKEQMGENYWILDAANASNTLLLASHAKGLGSCWCGVYPEKERMQKISALLSLPPHIEPLSLIALGYNSEEPRQPQNRFKVTKIHNNKW